MIRNDDIDWHDKGLPHSVANLTDEQRLSYNRNIRRVYGNDPSRQGYQSALAGTLAQNYSPELEKFYLDDINSRERQRINLSTHANHPHNEQDALETVVDYLYGYKNPDRPVHQIADDNHPEAKLLPTMLNLLDDTRRQTYDENITLLYGDKPADINYQIELATLLLRNHAPQMEELLLQHLNSLELFRTNHQHDQHKVKPSPESQNQTAPLIPDAAPAQPPPEYVIDVTTTQITTHYIVGGSQKAAEEYARELTARGDTGIAVSTPSFEPTHTSLIDPGPEHDHTGERMHPSHELSERTPAPPQPPPHIANADAELKLCDEFPPDTLQAILNDIYQQQRHHNIKLEPKHQTMLEQLPITQAKEQRATECSGPYTYIGTEEQNERTLHHQLAQKVSLEAGWMTEYLRDQEPREAIRWSRLATKIDKVAKLLADDIASVRDGGPTLREMKLMRDTPFYQTPPSKPSPEATTTAASGDQKNPHNPLKSQTAMAKADEAAIRAIGSDRGNEGHQHGR